MTLAGNARDLLISAFPRGADFWRIDWFGEIDFPDRMLRHTQPSVLVHLSKITDPRILADPGIPVDPGSTAAVASQARCWVSIGTATLLRIGDIWSDQRFVWSPEHEVETFEKLQIDESSARLLKAGNSDDDGTFLLPVREHPWHLGNTHSYCVRVSLADGRRLVIPCMELALFYFGSSSELLTRLFLPPLQTSALYTDIKFAASRKHLCLDLAEGLPRESAHDVGRIATSHRAWRVAAWIGTSLLRSPSGGAGVYPQCFFPFQGETALTASGRWLAHGDQARATFLVYRLHSCSHPFPFETLRYRTSGERRKRRVIDSRAASQTRGPRSGARDAKHAALRERDASTSLAPRIRRTFREHRFPDLVHKRIWGEAAVEGGTRPPTGDPGTKTVSDAAVGDPGSTERLRPIALVEALLRPKEPPEFLRAALARLSRLKRIKVTLLSAGTDDGWTIPMPYELDESGNIPREVSIDDGAQQRLRRLAVFAISSQMRSLTVALVESVGARVRLYRIPNASSVADLLLPSHAMRHWLPLPERV